MLRSGDRVVPRFQNEQRLAKPPLVHWIQSALFSVVGPREWAARLHAVASTLGSLLLVGALARRQFGPEGRTWAAAIFASMPLVIVLGRVGTLDALLAVHVLAIVIVDMVDETIPTNYRAILTGALLGLAFLIKGPVGVALPLLVMVVGRAIAKREVVPDLRSAVIAAAAWATVVLPWGLALIRRVGGRCSSATLASRPTRSRHGSS
jgi:4-amino-4-deoxy-L-arabinose transferase